MYRWTGHSLFPGSSLHKGCRRRTASWLACALRRESFAVLFAPSTDTMRPILDTCAVRTSVEEVIILGETLLEAESPETEVI